MKFVETGDRKNEAIYLSFQTGKTVCKDLPLYKWKSIGCNPFIYNEGIIFTNLSPYNGEIYKESFIVDRDDKGFFVKTERGLIRDMTWIKPLSLIQIPDDIHIKSFGIQTTTELQQLLGMVVKPSLSVEKCSDIVKECYNQCKNIDNDNYFYTVIPNLYKGELECIEEHENTPDTQHNYLPSGKNHWVFEFLNSKRYCAFEDVRIFNRR